eukprot:450562-Amphidinium_carterae.1
MPSPMRTGQGWSCSDAICKQEHGLEKWARLSQTQSMCHGRKLTEDIDVPPTQFKFLEHREPVQLRGKHLTRDMRLPLSDKSGKSLNLRRCRARAPLASRTRAFRVKRPD